MSTFSTVVVFVALGIGLYCGWIMRPWKVAATWRDFARKRGLDGGTGDFNHTGVVDGVGVVVERFRWRGIAAVERGRMPSRVWHTRITAHAPHPVPVAVTIRPETILASLVKLVELQDVQTGDPSFDEAFIVQASDEARARELLDRDVRIKLQLCQTDIVLEYDEGTVEAHWQGTEMDAGVLDRVLDAVVTMANVVGEGAAVAAVAEAEDARPEKRRRRRRAKRDEEVAEDA